MHLCKVMAVALLAVAASAYASDDKAPLIEKLASAGSSIELRVFLPGAPPTAPRSAIVLFHGGGWSEGNASWMDATAAQYAELGMVAVSVDYRLSRDSTTPFDAVDDARNAIRWVRQQAIRLRVSPDKIVAFGTSSGGHLAASTAVFDEPWGEVSAMPNALVLRSAAISVADSTWFRKLTGGAAQAAALSPALHIRKGLPPTILLQGEEDNVAPAAGAKLFCERMQKAGNICRLKLYPKVGHLFTHDLVNQEIPNYDAIDRDVSKDANQSTLAFLRELGFLPAAAAK